MSLDESSFFLAGQGAEELEEEVPLRSARGSTGVFSEEGTPLVGGALCSGGEDSRLAPHSRASESLLGLEEGKVGLGLRTVTVQELPCSAKVPLLEPSPCGGAPMEQAGASPAGGGSGLSTGEPALASPDQKLCGARGSTIGGDLGESGAQASGTGRSWLCWAGRREGVGA